MSFDSEHRPLRQYGFGPDSDFASLASSNRFLFRVHSPKHHQHELSVTSHADPEHVFALAQKFDRAIHSTPAVLPESIDVDALTYADVGAHMDWATRSTSPFVSTSFSFSWALWDAMRRYKENVKHDVQIAVIDALALRGQAVTAAQLLQRALPDERDPDHLKWSRYAQDSQTVLVHGYIPMSAVFTSIPFLSIVPDLPSYFLQYTPNSPLNHPLSNIVASLSAGKSKGTSRYRHFCASMVGHYERLPPDVRLREATVGAVRLAMTMLLPWLEDALSSDNQDIESYASGVRKTSQLAWTIACWAETRAGLLNDLYDVIEGIVQQLAEQIRRRKLDELDHAAKVEQLHWAIMEMEKVVSEYDGGRLAGHANDRRMSLTPIIEDEDVDSGDDSDADTAVHASPPATPSKRGSLSPRMAKKLMPLFSPLMGLDTPMPNMHEFGFGILGAPIELKPKNPHMIPLPPSPTPSSSSSATQLDEEENPFDHKAECSYTIHQEMEEEEEEEEEGSTDEDFTLVHMPEPSERECCAALSKEEGKGPRLEFIDESELDENSDYLPSTNPFSRRVISVERLGFLFSGFFFGAVVAVCAISANQKRMLLTHLT